MKNFNLSFKSRWLLLPLMLFTLSIGQTWAYPSVQSKNGSTNDTKTTWNTSTRTSGSAGAISWTSDVTCNSSSSGSINFAEDGYVTFSTSTVGKMITTVAMTTTTGSSSYYGDFSSNYGDVAVSSSKNWTVSDINSKSVTLTTSAAYRITNGGSVTVTYNTLTTVVKLNKNGGAADGEIKFAYDATAYTTSSFSQVTREGYTCTGYYTAAEGGDKILNSDGTRYENPSGWWSSNKWCKDATSAELYAQWQSVGPACTDPDGPGKGSINGTSATLTFSESGNYEIYCSTSNTAPTGSSSVSGSVSSGTSVTVSNLTYGTTYYYWGRKVCGENSKSNWIAGNPTTFTTTIPAPTGLNAGSLSMTGATFTITDNNNVNNYEIYYSETNSEPGASPSGTATTTTKTKAVTGLKAGTTYYCWVRAKGTNVNSSWFSGGSFTTVTLSSITISTPPTTVDYLNGETFSATGAVVTANYSNSISETVTATWNKTTLTTSDATVTASFTTNGVTKTANQTIHVYSVTVWKQNEQGTSITAEGVSAGVDVRTLSASATTASKYVFKGWKYATDGEGGTSISGSSLNGTPTGNVTVIAEFYAPRTVTWKVNNEAWTGKGGQETVARGSHVQTLPTAPNPKAEPKEGCGDRFMGWTDAENGEYVHETSNLYTSASQFPNADGNQIFYAVFADYTK